MYTAFVAHVSQIVLGPNISAASGAELILQTCDGVAAEAPTDEQVLNILSMVYKGSKHISKLIAAYEEAAKARPHDLHLLQTLLFTQTRYQTHPWVSQ